MPTPGERRALIFIAAIAALGVAARGWKELRADPTGGIQSGRGELARQIDAVDSAIATGGAKRKGRKKAIPPADRDSASAAPHGRGARPSTARVEPTPDTDRDPREGYRRRMEAIDSARAAVARRLTQQSHQAPAAPPSSPSGPPPGTSRRPTKAVDLDTASPEEIESLPYIGAALAARIVADRDARGPFGSLSGLGRVPGVGPSLLKKLESRVTFSLPSRLGGTGETWRAPRKGRRRGG